MTSGHRAYDGDMPRAGASEYEIHKALARKCVRGLKHYLARARARAGVFGHAAQDEPPPSFQGSDEPAVPDEPVRADDANRDCGV